jgi:uncharacterized OB-fold protein
VTAPLTPILRAAAYLPLGQVGKDRVLGPDEDGFTLAATALERAAGPIGVGPGPVSVEVIGDVGPAGEWGIASLLGVEARLRAHSPGPGALQSALRSALETPGLALVVAVTPGSSNPSDGEGTSAGSVAFLTGEALPGSPTIGLPRATTQEKEGPVAGARSWFQSLPIRDRDPWVGDWISQEFRGRGTPSERPAPPPPAARSVSEGAYLPRASYLEGLPSRWRFLAERCKECGRVSFPIRHRCRGCGRSDRLEAVRLPLDGGTVVATTWIGKGGQPTEFDPQVEASGPFGVALVEIAPSVRATLQLTDCEPGELPLGSRVVTLLRRIYSQEEEWRYARKAAPVRSPSSASR